MAGGGGVVSQDQTDQQLTKIYKMGQAEHFLL
jgi:hypothetical protein